MSAEQFLSLLEDRGLLAEKHVRSLRRQIADATKEVTATSIAKLLVKKGLLSKSQAKQLLETPTGDVDDPSKTVVTGEGIRPGLSHEAEPKNLDGLDLSPIEDELDAPPPVVASPDDDLAPLDEDLTTPEDLAPADGDELADGAIVGELLDDEAFEEIARPADTPMATGGPLSTDSPLSTGGKDRLGRKIKVKVGSGKNEWDTPLMLVGGGALAVLLLIGAVTYYLLYSTGGEELFKAAESHYSEGSYTNAISSYSKFIEEYPGHDSVSLARVHSELATLRLRMSGGDWVESWKTAQQVIDNISGERDFHEVHEELATLLPEIANGLTEEAKNGKDASVVDRSIQLATQAISLIQQTNIVPKKLRDEGKLKRIRDTLDLIRRDMSSELKLAGVLKTMQRELTSGNVAKAYAAHKQLLDEYPDLKSNQELSAMVRHVAEAEIQTVRTVNQRQPSESEEAASPVIASLAMANRKRGGESFSAAEGHVALFQIQGAVYAFDALSGRLLWRRHVGVDYSHHPVKMGSRESDDYLLADVSRNELLRVDSKTGDLRWRYAIGQRFAEPVIVGQQALVSDRSGRLTAIDLDSGDSLRHAVLPQPLSVAPAVHPNGKFAYQVGEHSSIHRISIKDLTCRQVVYQGHAAGTISVPPVVILRNVLLVENWGEKSSTLHVFKIDDQGSALEHVDEIRLTGRVHTPLIVDRRRVIVVTDQGQMKVFEVSTESEGSPLVNVAQRPATDEEPAIRFTALVGDQLWVADRRLAKFVIQAAGGRLASHPFDQTFEGDAFDYPLQMVGKLLIVVRRPADQAGWIVSALDTESGRTVWETQIAVPPASSPRVSLQPPRITVANSAGALFQLDAAAIKRRVQDQPLTAKMSPKISRKPVLSARVDLGEGRSVFTADQGSEAVLVYDPSASEVLTWKSLPDQLTCVPTSFRGALVAPTRGGQVFWIDPIAGRPSGTPFQPTLTPNKLPKWRRPAVIGENDEAFVLSDGRTKLYIVGVDDDPAQLVAKSESKELTVPLVSAVAVVGSVAYAADAENFLLSFKLPDLGTGSRTNLNAPIAWGPRRVGESVLLATAQDELLCFDAAGSLAWRVPLSEGPLAGEPLAEGGHFILAAKSGIVSRIDASSGQELNQVDLGQPLATGPVSFGKQWILIGHDGTLLVMNKATN